eukprot:TRINITY_DN12426_c0_g1_i2.p1 TRINITY_DN12426_c0_g1~~TRINITY_DN12426_c0_g1_i2.p1  ORF type:complete len:111 (+),score=6.21 TRINITY_DN12426_c0_g1_i2:199-531(+)
MTISLLVSIKQRIYRRSCLLLPISPSPSLHFLLALAQRIQNVNIEILSSTSATSLSRHIPTAYDVGRFRPHKTPPAKKASTLFFIILHKISTKNREPSSVFTCMDMELSL